MGILKTQFLYLQENASRLIESQHIIIILVVFSLIMFGMSFAFVFNCIRKLIRDHRIIQVSEFYFLNANRENSLFLSLPYHVFSRSKRRDRKTKSLRKYAKVLCYISENISSKVVPWMFSFVNTSRIIYIKLLRSRLGCKFY